MFCTRQYYAQYVVEGGPGSWRSSETAVLGFPPESVSRNGLFIGHQLVVSNCIVRHSFVYPLSLLLSWLLLLLFWFYFIAVIILFLSQSTSLLTTPPPVLAPVSWSGAGWATSCVVFGCWLSLNHDTLLKGYFRGKTQVKTWFMRLL